MKTRERLFLLLQCAVICVLVIAMVLVFLRDVAQIRLSKSPAAEVDVITSPTTSPAATFTPTSAPEPEVSMPVSSGSEGIQGAKLLMYHYVRTVNQDSDPIGYRLSVTPAAFEEQIRYLSEAGFRAATVASLLQGDALKNAVALTFDDGYEDFYLNAYPILARYNMTATVYVVSDWVGKSGYLNEEQIRELLAAGFEIGSHTVSHRELHKLSETDQIRQIRDSKLSLEQRFNTQVVSFCYPVGRYTDVTTRLVREAGYLGAVTTQPGVPSDTTNAYTIPRQRVSGGMSLSSFTALVR